MSLTSLALPYLRVVVRAKQCAAAGIVTKWQLVRLPDHDEADVKHVHHCARSKTGITWARTQERTLVERLQNTRRAELRREQRGVQ